MKREQIKNTGDNVGRKMVKMELTSTADGNVVWFNYCEKIVRRVTSQHKLKSLSLSSVFDLLIFLFNFSQMLFSLSCKCLRIFTFDRKLFDSESYFTSYSLLHK